MNTSDIKRAALALITRRVKQTGRYLDAEGIERPLSDLRPTMVVETRPSKLFAGDEQAAWYERADEHGMAAEQRKAYRVAVRRAVIEELRRVRDRGVEDLGGLVYSSHATLEFHDDFRRWARQQYAAARAKGEEVNLWAVAYALEVVREQVLWDWVHSEDEAANDAALLDSRGVSERNESGYDGLPGYELLSVVEDHRTGRSAETRAERERREDRRQEARKRYLAAAS